MKICLQTQIQRYWLPQLRITFTGVRTDHLLQNLKMVSGHTEKNYGRFLSYLCTVLGRRQLLSCITLSMISCLHYSVRRVSSRSYGDAFSAESDTKPRLHQLTSMRPPSQAHMFHSPTKIYVVWTAPSCCLLLLTCCVTL